MVVNFSKLNLRKRPNFIIRNFDGTVIGVLGHILNPSAIIRYKDFSEISFENNLTIPVQVMQKLSQEEVKKLAKIIGKNTIENLNNAHYVPGTRVKPGLWKIFGLEGL